MSQSDKLYAAVGDWRISLDFPPESPSKAPQRLFGPGFTGDEYADSDEQCTGMNEANGKRCDSGMDVPEDRQRIVEHGGIGAMRQERIRCPFCSELILRDAKKCRFCGEWLSMPERGVADSGAAGGNDLVGGERERNHAAFEDIQEIVPPPEAFQHADSAVPSLDDGPESEQAGGLDTVEQPQPRVAREVIPGEGFESGLTKKGRKGRKSGKKRRIPWLRALLLLLYLGGVAALAVFESDAQRILRDARAKESAEDHEGAVSAYRGILESLPFSFATIEAWQNLRRISQSQALEMPRPSWLSRIEGLSGVDFGARDVHLLPLAAWPVSAALLLLVLLTRIFRPGVAVLALLLVIAAAAGSIAQFAWYGVFPLAPAAEAAQELMEAPAGVFYASYLLLALTAIMTLTATTRRPSSHMAKIAAATARKR